MAKAEGKYFQFAGEDQINSDLKSEYKMFRIFRGGIRNKRSGKTFS